MDEKGDDEKAWHEWNVRGSVLPEPLRQSIKIRTMRPTTTTITIFMVLVMEMFYCNLMIPLPILLEGRNFVFVYCIVTNIPTNERTVFITLERVHTVWEEHSLTKVCPAPHPHLFLRKLWPLQMFSIQNTDYKKDNFSATLAQTIVTDCVWQFSSNLPCIHNIHNITYICIHNINHVYITLEKFWW